MLFIPVLLRILILHIILAIRWMLIKILSGVISAAMIAENVFVLVYILFQAVVNHVSIFSVRTAAPAALQINRTHRRAHEALLPYLPQLCKWQNNGQQSPVGHLLTVSE